MSEKLQTVAQLEDKCVDIRSNLLNFIHRIGMGHLGGELSIVEMAIFHDGNGRSALLRFSELVA